jgi:glycosyltransferase 2 family protein
LKWPLKQLALVIAGVASCYGLALYFTGQASAQPPYQPIFQSLASWSGLWAGLLCLASYGLRGWRWCLWMAHFDRPLPVAQGLRLYLAGYTFTPTPANVGEALRGMLLAKQPLDLAQSLAIFGAERLADLLCLLLLCLPGLYWLLGGSLGETPNGNPSQTLVVLSGAACLAVLGFLGLAWVLRRYLVRSQQRLPWLIPAWQCLRVRPNAWFALTLLAWSAQGLAVWLICTDRGLLMHLAQATGFYALAMVGGAASMLPAGLGGMEAIFSGLLISQGSELGQAALITVLVRLLTLWLAVAVGAMALLYSAAFAKDIRLT